VNTTSTSKDGAVELEFWWEIKIQLQFRKLNAQVIASGHYNVAKSFHAVMQCIYIDKAITNYNAPTKQKCKPVIEQFFIQHLSQQFLPV
jgi:hypothetical protein